MTIDESFMTEAINLAKKGISWTNPNPLVGAVIVKNGKVIGQGFHRKYGLPHAETEAITYTRPRLASLEGATLYVNLEPCNHFGKTPPCTEAIIQSGIKRVVCATIDPNPKVSGKGIEKLKGENIEVEVGVLAEEARLLNETFFTYHTKKRPFIALKFAQSLDGKIATKTGDSKWITNQKARDYARKLRSQYQAILVGINTVLKDDPHLGVRIPGKKDPMRIILDSYLKIPLKAQVLRDNNVIIATTEKSDREKLKELQKKNILVIILEGEKIPLPKLIKKLYELNIISVLVEGGSEVLGSFIDEKLVDKVYAFIAPIIIGGKQAKTSISGLGVLDIEDAAKFRNLSIKKFDDNYLFTGYIR